MKIRFSVSFLVFAGFVLLAANRWVFAVYVVSVILHEYAHQVTGGLFHCKFSEVRLYAFGAVTYGDIEILSPGEEILTGLAGPLLNLLLALLLTAMWWIVPSTYVYTDSAAMANLALALFNLLPAYPLDGGKVLCAALKPLFGYRRALKTVRILGWILASALFAACACSAFGQFQISLGVTAAMLVWASLSDPPEQTARRLRNLTLGERELCSGLSVRSLALSEELTLLDVLRRLNPDYFYRLYFYRGKTCVYVCDQFRLMQWAETQPLTVCVADLVQKGLQKRGNVVK